MTPTDPQPERTAFLAACEKQREPLLMLAKLEALAETWEATSRESYEADDKWGAYSHEQFAKELRAIINPTQP